MIGTATTGLCWKDKTFATACCGIVCVVIFQVLTLQPTTLLRIYPFETSFAPVRRLDQGLASYKSTCNLTYFPGIFKEDTFQKVTNETYIYSAYHDYAQPDRITIIGICKQIPRLTCQLWYKENTTSCMDMEIHNDSVAVRLKHEPCLMYCRLPDERPPFAVSLVRGRGHTAANNLVRVKSIGKANYTRNFTMCVSPLHSNFSDPESFVEWIEFNRILGADHFIVYNFSHANNMYRVIKYYQEMNLVEVRQWPLPMKVDGTKPKFALRIFYYGQPHVYNDCWYRCKGNSKFVVVTDSDEFIVPYAAGDITWYDMFKKMPEADGYRFRHCSFPFKNLSNDMEYSEKESAVKYKIRSLLVLHREGPISPFGHRGKYMVRTNVPACLETHSVRGTTNYLVNPYIGRLHHYRKNKVNLEQTGDFVEEKSVLEKYGRVLTKRIMDAWSKIDV